MTRTHRFLAAGLAVFALGLAGARAQEDLFSRAPWSAGVGIGRIQFEGDQVVKSGQYLALRLGYDFNPRWTAELDFNYAPSLSARTFHDDRYAISDDTYMVRLGLDILFHLRKSVQDLRWDPYLSAGVGVAHFGEDLSRDGNATTLVPIVGAGMFYHFDDVWAVRADARYVPQIVRNEAEMNALVSVGLNCRWGAMKGPAYVVTGGALDSDGDGLLDTEEATYGTDPYDPDTDKDGLTDGQEVRDYKTDPLNPDTDWDALKDGAEVLTYGTNPLEQDTDKGGVADGHEVIEDHTDPLNPADDLQLFTLNIEFDYDKAAIRPEYFDKLDVVAKVLQRDPGSTARVEGHADKRPHSSRTYNLKLSERRAKAVMDYLLNVGGIDRSRVTYKGYGFDRPVAPNDTEANMQKNRRTEIYIRRGGAAETSTASPMTVP